jgi:cytolysin (calcineurin-like family phosphatase)
MRLRSSKPDTLLADGNLHNENRAENHHTRTLILATVLVCFSGPTAAGQVRTDAATPTKQDSTFVFSADIHVGFDGKDDTHGFWDFVNTNNSTGAYNYTPIYITDETAVAGLIGNPYPAQQNGCIPPNSINPPLPALKDLCNQIQHVRKVNALPANTWPTATFLNGEGMYRTLGSQGLIPQPRGLVIGGDLTDCAGGNDEYCINYNGSNSAQLVAFESLYDIFQPKYLSFNSMSFLPGLVNPDASTPVQLEIFPGLGNHDIDNPGISNNMFNYMTQHLAFLRARDTSGADNMNIDSATTAYSWNWGNLHVVNVGVYPGSLNDYSGNANGVNYNWGADSDAFLLNDLKNNASDGRPVVIASHFGFDDYSLNGNWWNGANRVCGLTDLWTELNKFNVVGYYHGHTHGYRPYDAVPNIQYAYKYPFAKSAGSPAQAPLPQIPYDIFLPGAAYYQSLAVTRITDSRMDVAMVNNGEDFVVGNNQTLDFAPTGLFTKVLTLAPVVTAAPFLDVAHEIQILGFNIGNQPYVIGVDGFANYSIRSINAVGSPSFLSGGQFPPTMTSMASYAAQDGTHIVVMALNNILDYRFTQNKLVSNWTAPIAGGSMMTFAKGLQNYLVVDSHVPRGDLLPSQEFLAIYQINTNGLSPMGTPYTQLNPVFSTSPQLQTYQKPNAGLLGMIEFDPNYGTAIFYTIDLNAFSILQINREQWAAGRMRILNFPYGEVQILLTTPSGIMVHPSTPAVFAFAACPATPRYWQGEDASAISAVPAANPDSPVYVLSLLTDAIGNNFTDVSWRGLPSLMPYVDVPTAQSDSTPIRPSMPYQTIDNFVTSSAGGSLYVSSYHAAGLLTRLSFNQPTGVNVTFAPNSQNLTITVNGSPVPVPGTISLLPGQTYTLSAPASFSPQAGIQYSNPVWSSNVNPDNTFTVPSTDTTVYLSYQAQIQITTAANPPGAGAVSGGGWIPANNVVSFQAIPNAGYTFSSFSGLMPSTANPLTFKVTYPGQITANFSPAGVLAISVTTQGARTDGPGAGQRTVPLEVVNGNGSGIGSVIVTAIDGIQVLTGTGTVSVAGGLAVSLGALPPNGTANFNVVMNWPATADRVRFVVHFQGNSGAYTGTSTLTLNR